jgi:hypothetical protein
VRLSSLNRPLDSPPRRLSIIRYVDFEALGNGDDPAVDQGLWISEMESESAVAMLSCKFHLKTPDSHSKVPTELHTSIQEKFLQDTPS